MAHYVTFEQSKKLKEKGFDELTSVWRQHGDGISGDVEGKKDFYNRKGDIYTALPEHSQVVDWLLKNHKIWVSVHLELCRGYEGYDFNFEFINNKEQTIIEQEKQYKKLGELVYDTPHEAYSAAFDYILDELI